MCVSFSLPSAVFPVWTGHCINVIHAKCYLPSHWSLLLPTSIWCIIFLSGSCDIITPFATVSAHDPLYKTLLYCLGYFSSWFPYVFVLSLSVFCTCAFAFYLISYLLRNWVNGLLSLYHIPFLAHQLSMYLYLLTQLLSIICFLCFHFLFPLIKLLHISYFLKIL